MEKAFPAKEGAPMSSRPMLLPTLENGRLYILTPHLHARLVVQGVMSALILLPIFLGLGSMFPISMILKGFDIGIIIVLAFVEMIVLEILVLVFVIRRLRT